MNIDTGRILPEQNILENLFLEKENQAQQKIMMRQAGWKPFAQGDPTSLFDGEGNLIGHFQVNKIMSRNRVVIKGISAGDHAELCKRK